MLVFEFKFKNCPSNVSTSALDEDGGRFQLNAFLRIWKLLFLLIQFSISILTTQLNSFH